MEKTIDPNILKVSQKIGWIVLRPILKFFIRYRLEPKTDIKKLIRPLIIVSNHTSYLDPLIIGTILPINSKVYPLYFITKDTVIAVPIFGCFLKFLGAFAARKGEGLEKSLEEPKQILKDGYSVVFFPQAHRYAEFKLDQGRPGVAALALESGQPLLPVGIAGIDRLSWKDFFLRRYRVKIEIGPPFFLKEKLGNQPPANLRQPTEIIMKEIEKLLK